MLFTNIRYLSAICADKLESSGATVTAQQASYLLKMLLSELNQIFRDAMMKCCWPGLSERRHARVAVTILSQILAVDTQLGAKPSHVSSDKHTSFVGE